MTLDIEGLQDATVVDQDGGKIGSVGQIYVDDQTSQPTFATVKTGLFGTKETFVPLHEATKQGNDLQVPYTKDYVHDAPKVDADGHLTEQEQDEIYRYYNLDDGADRAGVAGDGVGDAQSGQPGGVGAAGTTGGVGAAGAAGGAQGDERFADDRATDDRRSDDLDTGRSGAVDPGRVRDTDRQDAAAQQTADARDNVDAGDNSVTLREEQLNVGTERVQTGRARIRKYVVTEQQTVTVPVEREEFEVVREPVTGGGTGGTLGEETAEVSLSEERPVVDKEVVDKERVGFQTRKVTDEQQVQAEVGHEEFAVERDGDEPPTDRRPNR